MNERSFIDAFVAEFPRAGAGVALGPGDDCAAMRVAPGHLLCATTDALLDGIHFSRTYFTPREAGHKALAVNLSDLAAMGAAPRWFLCAVTLAAEDDAKYALGAARGMAKLAREAGCALVGGNVARGKLGFTITALGEAPHAALLTRAGAKPGDLLYAVGTVGDAALGLEQLRRGRPARLTGPMRAQLTPAPQLAAGLAAAPIASAAIDVSDGLAQDAGHLARASGGLRIELASLPISRALKALPEKKRWALATAGGEDYALLLAVEQSRATALEAALRDLGARATRIGEAVAGSGVTLVRPDGGVYESPHGFDHLA